MENIIALVVAIIGSGGIASALTAFLSARKYRAEASSIEQQVEAARIESEQKMNLYIRDQLKELSETHKRESEDLRVQNNDLAAKVNALNERINNLMQWIIVDNNAYRSWLENELLKLRPDIQFPKCKPAPGFDHPATTDTESPEVPNSQQDETHSSN